MPKVRNKTILNARRKARHSSDGRTAVMSRSLCLPDSLTIGTTYGGKYYSQKVSLDKLRLSYGNAVKVSRTYGKGI